MQTIDAVQLLMTPHPKTVYLLFYFLIFVIMLSICAAVLWRLQTLRSWRRWIKVVLFTAFASYFMMGYMAVPVSWAHKVVSTSMPKELLVSEYQVSTASLRVRGLLPPKIMEEWSHKLGLKARATDDFVLYESSVDSKNPDKGFVKIYYDLNDHTVDVTVYDR